MSNDFSFISGHRPAGRGTAVRRSLFAISVAAASLFGAATAEATVSACSRTALRGDPWNLHPVRLEEGALLADRLVYTEFRFTVGLPESYRSRAVVADGSRYNALWSAYPIQGLEGVGLRIRFVGSAVREGPESIRDDNYQATVGPNALQYMSTFAFGRAGTYRVEQYWQYEVVMLNPAAYQGGTPGAGSNVHLLGADFASAPTQGSTANESCNLILLGIGPFNAALGGGTPPPVLPPPPPPVRPTCRFDTATLNQSVQLRRAHYESVAADGSARSSGDAGEAGFSLQATGCGRNASFRIHFTDPVAPTNSSSTLGLAATSINRQQLGLRLYHGEATTPLRFGSVPGGNAPGSNYIAISVPSGGAVNVPFTAQYVRRSGVAPSQLQPGPIAASATLTIVYP